MPVDTVTNLGRDVQAYSTRHQLINASLGNMMNFGTWKRSKPGEQDPEASLTHSSDGPNQVVVGSNPGYIPHSYSANFTAKDLAYARLGGRSSGWDSDSPRSGPPKMRTHGHRRSCNDLILAFIAGKIVRRASFQTGETLSSMFEGSLTRLLRLLMSCRLTTVL